jgi:[acyl-carrier-protein] S-malonyltransferase
MVAAPLVFLFPGQGAQAPGMAVDLFDKYDAVKKLFALANDIFARDALAMLRDSSADELRQTDVAQPAIALSELAVRAALLEHGITASATAGHSLGEYPALCTAGVIGEAECLRLVAARGKAFSASGAAPGGMAAVVGLAPEAVEGLVAEWTAAGLSGLYAANLNSPRQTVVSGTLDALAEAEARFPKAGARRFIKLAVGGPFHSPLMAGAADSFAKTLETAVFADPSIPFFSNVSGKQVASGAELKALAVRQITQAVRWTEIEAGIAALNPGAVLETGPGKTLCGLWKDTGSAAPCHAAGTVADIEQLN